MFIPEEEYKRIIKSFPVFCVDFLIKCQDKYLLIKRTDEPVKGVYWVIGGRMYFKETLQELAKRVQMREIGRYIPDFKLIGFSNYFFPNVPDERATHTPTMLYLVEVDEMFTPQLDDTHSDFIWTDELPEELKKQTDFIFDYEQLHLGREVSSKDD
jgi:colanic acid biosynthesis protein WcaH